MLGVEPAAAAAEPGRSAAGGHMPIDERWERLGPSDWDAFARAWIAELRGTPEESESDVAESVVMMNFTARPEQQWQFILAAVARASDEELGHIAAGPVEHLLGKHAEEYIAEVERRAASDPKSARMLAGVWKYMMSDDVWARVQALKERLADSSEASEQE
jgi:hypothetical protein